MTTTNLRLRHTNRRLARPTRRESGLEKNRSTLVQDGVAGVARRALRGVAGGRLAAFPVAVRFWDGSVMPACAGAVGAPTVLVRNRRALSELLHEPNEIGLTRAWVQRDLDVEGDLEAVVALRGRQHSVARDREAVRHHYELSNHFYELMLGASMVYSCACFEDDDGSLEQAQERKLEMICQKLRLAPGERLLDIGCGWGSLLLHAARRHGVQGVGVTLSDAQAELARERIARAGLSRQVEIRVRDYRQVDDGPYDKIASVGMYEHVGRDRLDLYVSHIDRLLRPGGLFLNHGITRLRQRPRGEDTFISRYIFPDGELHPVTDVLRSMEIGGLEIRDVESLREHYVLTLRRWIANLDAQRESAIREVGEMRLRAWRLYLLGCAHAFATGQISVFQTLSARGGADHGLPLDRRALMA